MMGFQTAPVQLFYDFCLDDHVPSDHLLRRMRIALWVASRLGISLNLNTERQSSEWTANLLLEHRRLSNFHALGRAEFVRCRR